MGKREREIWGEEGFKDPSEKNRMGISTRVSMICRKEFSVEIHITFIVKFVEGIGVDREGIWGEEGL